VVDKLLTGFDAPTATYLYIDKHMQDHNLFQAICRVNRVESDKKEFGYIIDYKDLFNEIKGAVQDYTNGAFSNFEEGDVAGLLKNRLTQGKKDLDEALEAVEGICMNVNYPRKADNFFDYFVFDQAITPVDEQQAVTIENSNKREMFYDAVRTLTNRYLAIATQMVEAGYTIDEAKAIHDKVTDFDNLRSAIMLRSGDTTDLKGYNAMMRQLLDQYVQAPRSELIAKLEDFSFLDLIEDGEDKVIDGIVDEEHAMGGEPAAAETISANVRKYVVRKRDSNPEYFDKLSERLNKILEEMKDKSVEYKETLKQLIEMIKEIKHGTNRPDSLNTDGKRALFDNLNNDEALALKAYDVIKASAEQGFRDENFPGRAKRKKIRDAVSNVEGIPADKLDIIMSIVINNPEF
jgi:type I restriction enzyme R subunit